MKKIFSFFLLAIAMGSISTGCGGGMSSASPKEVLVAFFEKLAKKDIDGAAKLATKDSKATMEMMKKGLAAEQNKEKNPDSEKEDLTEDFKNVEIGEANINGDNATVAIKNKKKNDEQFDFPLKKEDGAWKVDFSMNTLMTMGMKQMNKHKMENDGDMKGMEGMEGMSDSIQAGMKMLDSTLKTVDPKKLEETMKALEKLKKPQ